LLSYNDGPAENRLEPKLNRPGRRNRHFECLFDVAHFIYLQIPQNGDFIVEFYKQFFWST
jgi:hypothetical protein